MLNTSHKILLARILGGSVMTVRRLFGLSSNVTKTRGGITWSLDLKEGIDLAIFALGGFEVRTLRKYESLIQNGDIVLDIGANIGAHTLPLAKLVGEKGRVVAFEPTQYAFNKLEKNISLNSTLASRITARQMMLVNENSDALPKEIYSSWPLENSSDLHEEHRGRLMSTQGASTATLDSYIRQNNLQRIDFIKLDVDGNEFDVLMGAQETLKQFKPALMMELAPYVYESSPEKFDETLHLLWNLGYQISEVASDKILPVDVTKVRQLIPKFGGMNILATRKETKIFSFSVAGIM